MFFFPLYKNLQVQKDLFLKQLDKSLNEHSARNYLKIVKNVSNKEPSEKDFLELKTNIYETAKNMPSWGKELPLRWIHLEIALDRERDAGSNILPFHLVCQLAKSISLFTTSENNKEIILFLKYQHECGHVIFFKDLSDYVILNPRWLIDAFKHLVSDRLKDNLAPSQDRSDLKKKGKLTDKLISEIFENVAELEFLKYKKHLLPILEKFDIIVKPKNEDLKSYYMPCMMKSLQFDEIYKNYNVQICHRTSWLLLEFRFLPPAFFYHILVHYIKELEVCSYEGELSLYRGIGVFDIEKQGCKKLVICADKNIIAFQVWIYEDNLDSQFHYIPQTLTKMVDMLSKRYQICCKYKIKMKCSKSDYRKAVKSYEYKDIQGSMTCFCYEHSLPQACVDVYKYWFSNEVVVSYTCNY